MELPILTAGDTAPNFSTTDVTGRTINLSDYAKKSVFLVFLRYAECPWCNLTIQRLTLEHPMLAKQNCEIIAFMQADQASIIKNVHERHTHVPKFPIIADPDKKFYNQYGVQSSKMAMLKSVRRLPQWVNAVAKEGFTQSDVNGDVFLVPATFLLAPHTQKIIHANYGTSFYDFESLFPIYESLIFKDD